MDVAECTRSPTGTLSFVAGSLLAAGYFVFGDALLLHTMHDVEPPVTAAHWVPALLAMIAFGMLLLAPVGALVADGGFGGDAGHCTRLWVFCSFTLFFMALIAAVFMLEAMRGSTSAYSYIASARLEAALVNSSSTSSNSTYDDVAGEWYHLYVGYAVIAETALIFASAATCLLARMQRAETGL